MSKSMKLNTKNINIRIGSDLNDAITTCAKSIDERKSVFVRTALINRLTELGIYTFGDLDADPWGTTPPSSEK